MNQLELFDIPVEDYDDGLECNNCGIVQPANNFQHMQSGEIKRKCRTCAREQSNLIKYLKSVHPYPDETYACPICTRSIDQIGRKGQRRLQNWVLDHCHDTETYRGWLCHHCNTGLGSFKDDIDRIRNAVSYLQKHKDTLENKDA